MIRLALALALVLALPSAAVAASPWADDTATVSISDPSPSHGDTVTVTAMVAGINGWTLWGECWQGDQQVLWFGGVTQHGDATYALTFTLDSAGWVDGGAECWAGVRNYDRSTRRAVYEKPLLSFTVLPQ